jgi:hypothetical protein
MMTVIATLLVASAALAADAKTAPGTMCAGNDVNIAYGSGGVSASGGAADVFCSIVRDNNTNTDGLDDLDVMVSGNVLCVAYAVTSFGNVDDSNNQSGGSSGDHHLNWGTNIDVSSVSGAYLVNCVLDSGEGVYTYEWTEP